MDTIKIWSERIQWLLLLLIWVFTLCMMWGDNWLYMIINTPLDMEVNLYNKQDYMMIIDQTILPRWNLYKGIYKPFLIPSIPLGETTRRGEAEQLLTNMELLQNLKNIYPEFNKYFFCPIDSHKYKWSKPGGGADAVLFDSATRHFANFQFKFFWGNLNNKRPSDFTMYQETTDVLDITLTHNINLSEFINRLKTHGWMMDVWIQTQGQTFDKSVLAQSIQSHHHYLCPVNYKNHKDINTLCYNNFSNINTDDYKGDVERYPDWAVLDALKEIKGANCKNGAFIMRNRSYPLQ